MTTRIPKLIAATVAAALFVLTLMTVVRPALAGAQPAGAVAQPSEPRVDTYFNTKDNWGNDGPIDSAIVAAISQAGPKAEIRAAFYYAYPSNDVIGALNTAIGAGVDVRLILDEDAGLGGGTEARINEGMFTENGEPLNASLSNFRREDIVFCKDSCSPLGTSNSIMHNKFLLVSEPGQQSVVVQSSRNLTPSRRYENALVFFGHEALFDRYERLWTRLAHRDLASPYDENNITGKEGSVRLYAYPRGDGDDTVVSILDNINTSKPCTVRVAMAFFTRGRAAVADKLRQVQAGGCSVAVITDDSKSTADLTGLNAHRTNDLHSKYLLIDADDYYDGNPNRLVFTGSHNLTGPALHYNDEVMLRVNDPKVYADYVDDFRAMWSDQISGQVVSIAASLANPAGADGDGGEWVEFANNTVAEVDLSMWSLKDMKGGWPGGSSERTAFSFPAGTKIEAFDTLRVYVKKKPNGSGLVLDVSAFLNNGGDRLRLVDGVGATIHVRCYASSNVDDPVTLSNC